MEIVVYGVLTSMWWMSTAVLLPYMFLLKYSTFFRIRWFSYIFKKWATIYFFPKFTPLREKTFELLKGNLSQRDQSDPLKVLEIGIGSGANFEFYPENSYLTALDNDLDCSFDSYFYKNQRHPNIVYVKTIISVAENMKDIEDSTMDVVISTYVLCCVTSINDVMKEIKRVLKPGGKFLFLEHVSYPNSAWGFTIQKFANPLWVIYNGDGCCLLRNIEEDIKKAGFSDVMCENIFPKSVMLYIRSQIYGLATK